MDQTPPVENHAKSPPPVARHELSRVTTHKAQDFMPPTVQKSSKFRSLWLLFIVFLVLSVVGVGIYIIDAETKKTASQVNALQTPTPEISRTATPQVTVPPLSQTFTDPLLDYSFRYPETVTPVTEDATIVFTDSGGTEIITIEVTDDRETFINPEDFESCSVVLHDAETTEDSTCVTIDSNKINFGPNEASHFVFIKVGADGGSSDIYQTTNPALQFTLTFASGQEDGEVLFRQLLPTFTFSASSSAAPTSGSDNQ